MVGNDRTDAIKDDRNQMDATMDEGSQMDAMERRTF